MRQAKTSSLQADRETSHVGEEASRAFLAAALTDRSVCGALLGRRLAAESVANKHSRSGICCRSLAQHRVGRIQAVEKGQISSAIGAVERAPRISRTSSFHTASRWLRPATAQNERRSERETHFLARSAINGSSRRSNEAGSAERALRCALRAVGMRPAAFRARVAVHQSSGLSRSRIR